MNTTETTKMNNKVKTEIVKSWDVKIMGMNKGQKYQKTDIKVVEMPEAHKKWIIELAKINWEIDVEIRKAGIEKRATNKALLSKLKERSFKGSQWLKANGYTRTDVGWLAMQGNPTIESRLSEIKGVE